MFARSLATAGIAGALALVGAPVFAQSNCAALCAVQCAKPISFPDRWDDATGIPGYMGELVGTKTLPNWRNNHRYDTEAFIDGNANGLWDPGETFTDGNGNGSYDAEVYDPATTGYNAGPSALSPSGDLGTVFTLGPSQTLTPIAGQYMSIDYPPVNRGTPIPGGPEYRDNWARDMCTDGSVGAGDLCQPEPGNMVLPTNQAMRDLIAQDPQAHWDPATSSVQGSGFQQSPRVIFIPVHDPRIPLSGSTPRLHLTKVVAFFMDHMTGSAVVEGRFVRALGTGEACATGGAGFVVECPTPAQSTSWGRVKDLYR